MIDPDVPVVLNQADIENVWGPGEGLCVRVWAYPFVALAKDAETEPETDVGPAVPKLTPPSASAVSEPADEESANSWTPQVPDWDRLAAVGVIDPWFPRMVVVDPGDELIGLEEQFAELAVVILAAVFEADRQLELPIVSDSSRVPDS
jgi:hypothetical protein